MEWSTIGIAYIVIPECYSGELDVTMDSIASQAFVITGEITLDESHDTTIDPIIRFMVQLVVCKGCKVAP